MIILEDDKGNLIEYKKITRINFYEDCILINGYRQIQDGSLDIGEGEMFDKFLWEYQKIKSINFSD